MKHIQLQQIDTMQAIIGWNGLPSVVNVHVDMEAVRFVDNLRNVEVGEKDLAQVIVKSPTQKEHNDAEMQLGEKGSEVPKSKTLSQ